MINIMFPIDETKRQAQVNSVNLSQVIRNVTGVEQIKEKKSVLQQLLEPKEVEDSQKDVKKALEIAKRIARGAPVSPEEKRFLMQVDPKLAQMAELARQEGERIKHALSQASTKEQQQAVIQQAYQMVMQVSKKNEQFGMLLGEAVKGAVEDSKKKTFKQTLEEQESSKVWRQGGNQEGQSSSLKNSDTQQALLEQFFPDEWMSMLDYRG